MTVYRVVGGRAYREHQPGSIFEVVLDPAAEKRALLRGNIVVLKRGAPQIRPGSYRLPKGWHPSPITTGSPARGFSFEGSQ